MQSEKLWFLRRRENQSTWRKISRLEARKRTNNRLNPCLVTHIQQQQTQPMYGKLDQGYSLVPPFLFITTLDVSMVSISFGIWSVFMLCLKGALLSFSSSKSLLLFSVSE